MKRELMSRLMLGAVMAGATACRPSDILSVPAPATVVASPTLETQTGAEAAWAQARRDAFAAFEGTYGLTNMSGLLTDEMVWASSGSVAVFDARYTAVPAGETNLNEWGDNTISVAFAARSELLIAAGLLQKYEVPSAKSRIGEMYGLVAYLELTLAEDYCAGVTLSETKFGGGVEFGSPLTTDALLDSAEVHFDSALAYDNGSDTIQMLASVGMGRALLDRQQYDSAAAAVQNVPTSFVYNTYLATSFNPYEGTLNLYAIGALYTSGFTVGDNEGVNGLNFVSAHDLRLALDTTVNVTGDYYNGIQDSIWYYPVKFGNPSAQMPLATGLEARLIEAEATLPGNPGTAIADLNAMRTNGPGAIVGIDTTWTMGTGQVNGQTSGLAPLADPGTDSGRVSLLFRERAFWLYGIGTRLGDMRRLIRQYNRPSETVFPTGTYQPSLQNNATWVRLLPEPLTKYGADVNITLPTPGGGNQALTANPNYKGCITSTTTA